MQSDSRIATIPVGSGSRRAKMTHKNRKTLYISFFEVLDVVFRGRKASHVAWESSMEA